MRELQTNKQAKCKTDDKSWRQTKFVWWEIKSPVERKLYLDEQNWWNASRFFKSIIYQAKSSKSDRNSNGAVKNIHPTCKPTKLMEYLIKMITPKGWTVLDPFTWSWTTLIAAKQNWYQYIGCELTEEYIPIIEARLNATELIEKEINPQQSLFWQYQWPTTKK